MFNFRWWRDKNNREAAMTIVHILKVVVPLPVAALAVLGVVFYDGSGEEGSSVEIKLLKLEQENKIQDLQNQIYRMQAQMSQPDLQVEVERERQFKLKLPVYEDKEGSHRNLEFEPLGAQKLMRKPGDAIPSNATR